jgi:hypothetical protein
MPAVIDIEKDFSIKVLVVFPFAVATDNDFG